MTSAWRDDDNPFERYELDPRDGIGAITERLKELAEDARDGAERERIRVAWEELTLHPVRRLRAALFAHPETRPALGSPPLLARRRPRLTADAELVLPAPRPSLGATVVGVDLREVGELDDVPPLDGDPVLRGARRYG
jgi:hypothetical protein